MSCSTSFNLSSPTSQVSHRNMACSEALQLISQLKRNAPDEYLTDVTITKKIGLFQEGKMTEFYVALSHRKFSCLLKCETDNKHYSEYAKCRSICSGIFDQINRNRFDCKKIIAAKGGV